MKVFKTTSFLSSKLDAYNENVFNWFDRVRTAISQNEILSVLIIEFPFLYDLRSFQERRPSIYIGLMSSLFKFSNFVKNLKALSDGRLLVK